MTEDGINALINNKITEETRYSKQKWLQKKLFSPETIKIINFFDIDNYRKWNHEPIKGEKNRLYCISNLRVADKSTKNDPYNGNSQTFLFNDGTNDFIFMDAGPEYFPFFTERFSNYDPEIQRTIDCAYKGDIVTVYFVNAVVSPVIMQIEYDEKPYKILEARLKVKAEQKN